MVFQIRYIVPYFICLLLVFGLGACSSSAVRQAEKVTIVPGKVVNLDDRVKVKKLLKSQYNEWKRVKHRLGGLSKEGVDCSGLVYVTYLSKLGIRVPRSTELQSKMGVAIKQNQLRPGDLVFFKTGLKQRHVGIYMGNRQFMHASSSKGVRVSHLDNVYWARSYWKARRVKF
ncbi:MAG: NlpC/P60 family protein [Gammaproteobacteria bacterium]|nr:NlpC/P60 family protein [Gammaproteobacteria bacterium]MDH5734755.1 NlpC/P60 family protein [Gammaproteobacteria bacterium]